MPDAWELWQLFEFVLVVIAGIFVLVMFSAMAVLSIFVRIRTKIQPWWRFWDWQFDDAE